MNTASSKAKRRATKPALSNDKRIVAAARSAVRRTLKQHKALGTPIVVWKDGKVVRVTADKIKV